MNVTAAHSLPLLLYITDAEGLGGAEGYLETLLAHADQTHFRVALALPQREATRPLVERALARGVAVYWLEAVHRDGLGMAAGVRALALLARLRPAVVHAVLNGPRRCAETLLAAWLLGVPRRLATFQLVTAIPQFHGWAAVARVLNRRLQFRTLHAGIAVSRGNAQLLVEQYGFPAPRLHTVPNGVDMAAFQPVSGSQAARRFGAAHDAPPVLGVVGRLSGQKGHAVLFAAMPAVWARFPATRLQLVGAGEQAAALRVAAQRIDGQGRIEFAGALPAAAIPAALAALDVFVLPSLYEGLPFAVVEAMAAGLPVVATNVDGSREAIVDGVSGLLVPPGDPAALAVAICRVLGDDTLRQALGAAARREAERLFDHRAMLAATFALYTGVV